MKILEKTAFTRINFCGIIFFILCFFMQRSLSRLLGVARESRGGVVPQRISEATVIYIVLHILGQKRNYFFCAIFLFVFLYL